MQSRLKTKEELQHVWIQPYKYVSQELNQKEKSKRPAAAVQHLSLILHTCQFTKTSERIFKAADRLKWYKNLGNKDGIKELS